jgi:hypothetical protein
MWMLNEWNERAKREEGGKLNETVECCVCLRVFCSVKGCTNTITIIYFFL